jgi:hypothetical protein
MLALIFVLSFIDFVFAAADVHECDDDLLLERDEQQQQSSSV